MPKHITERELRDAFQASGLWRRGWTYARAINSPAVSMGLKATAAAARRRAERMTKPVPAQTSLI